MIPIGVGVKHIQLSCRKIFFSVCKAPGCALSNSLSHSINGLRGLNDMSLISKHWLSLAFNLVPKPKSDKSGKASDKRGDFGSIRIDEII